MQNQNYKCIYDRLQEPEVSYPKPIILENNNYESDKGYWKRINQYTINNNTLINQTVECPYCHSNDTKSTTSRIMSTNLFSFGSKKIGKQ